MEETLRLRLNTNNVIRLKLGTEKSILKLNQLHKRQLVLKCNNANESNYNNLTNLPKINSVTLAGNKTGSDLGLASSSDIPTKTSDLTNDSGFITSSYHDSTKQDTISDLGTIRSGAALGATSIQPNNNVSELTNDAGYITDSYHDSSKENVGKITISGTEYTASKHTLSWTNNGTTYSYEVVTV